MKKISPRYSPKEQVCKIQAKFDHFWSLQAAPNYLEQTNRHSQILAQLKLRKIRVWGKRKSSQTDDKKQGTSVKNLSQIRPFLKSPGCLKDSTSFWQKLVPRPKNQNFWKHFFIRTYYIEKKKFYQRTFKNIKVMLTF